MITSSLRSSAATIAAIILGLAVVLACAGCVSLAEDVAEAPYKKAMKQGRMLPSEFKQQQEAIRQAAEPVK